MDITIPKSLCEKDYESIQNLLLIPQEDRTDLEQMWYIMDEVWDTLRCKNDKLDWNKVGEFYAHPVWLLNGFFTEQHDDSSESRNKISDWIVQKIKQGDVLDYGGGFGALAIAIACKNKSLQVDIFEPYPSDFAINSMNKYENITILSELNKKEYDCVIAMDVLEHVEDPLKLLSEMADSVKMGGILIEASCFYPVIKCHLPKTFHLRYSIGIFLKMMGFQKSGCVIDGYATHYIKVTSNSISFKWIRITETISKILFPFFNIMRSMVKPIYHWLIAFKK